MATKVAKAYSEAKNKKKRISRKPKHKTMKPSIKEDGYEVHYGREIEEMMNNDMKKSAKIKVDDTDLNNGKMKPVGESFSECARKDSKRAYKRAGLNKRSGADNDKESLEYAHKTGIKTKNRK